MSEKSLTLLGATGSIGRSTLDVVRRSPGRFKVHALAARGNVAALAKQVELFKPRVAVVYDQEAAGQLRDMRLNGGGVTVLEGMEGLLEAVTDPAVEHVMAGMVGAVGLLPVHAAVSAGKTVSVANKEVMVLAGELIFNLAREKGCRLLPVDSEHNAIFQCLEGNRARDVSRIILTASGGPFRDLPLSAFPDITKAQALDHPNWDMGPKITIDSATMMNKGLEIIEARWFFGLEPERIAVLMHRQSIVHSMVEYSDGSVIAQLGLPDMRTPIAFCLGHPERLPLDTPKLNLAETGRLDFAEATHDRYPCLFLALDALKLGGGVPAALNGANEAVVAAYLDDAFSFIKIGAILELVMNRIKSVLTNGDAPAFLGEVKSVDEAIRADAFGRQLAGEVITNVVAGNG